MFNLGFWEMVVLAGIALIVVGPEKLPGLARNVGRFVNDLKRTTNTIASDITDAVDEENFLNSDKGKNNKADEHLDVSFGVETHHDQEYQDGHGNGDELSDARSEGDHVDS